MKKLSLEELNRLSIEDYKSSSKHPVVVVLDNIRSLHNVGSVFRNADAFRIQKLWLCGYTPRPPHREITKTAIGAELSVDWEHREDILPLMEELKQEGYQLLVLEQTEGSISPHDFQVDPEKKYAVILGNEVEGVQQSVIDICDAALEIPQYGTKHSLNVSVAGGILLYALIGGLYKS